MRTFVDEAKKRAVDTALDRRAEGHDLTEGAALVVDARDPRGAEFTFHMMMRCGLPEADARKRLTTILSEAKRTGGFPISTTWVDADGLLDCLKRNKVPESTITKLIGSPPPDGTFRALMLGEGKMAVHTLPLPRERVVLTDFKDLALREAAASARRRQQRSESLGVHSSRWMRAANSARCSHSPLS